MATPQAVVVTLAAALALGGNAVAGPAPAPAAPIDVKLVSPGDGPRSLLRLAPKSGAHETMSMVMDMSIAMKMGTTTSPTNAVPEITMAMDVKVAKVAPTGDITYDYSFGTPKLDPKAAAELTKAMAPMMSAIGGTHGHASISSTGISHDVTFELPKDASPAAVEYLQSIKQSIDQVSFPLPVEPVALGATWTAKTQVTSKGITLDQVTTYKLLAHSGSHIKIDYDVMQTAANQTFQTNGVTAKLISAKTTGHGTTEVDLTHVVPDSGTIGMSSAMAVEAGGEKVDMTIDMTVKVAGK